MNVELGLTRFAADTWLLLSLRWRLAWNQFRARSLARQVVPALLIIVVGAFTGSGTFAFGYAAGRLVRRFPSLRLEPLLPSLILTVPLLLLVAVAFGITLGTLFLANDLDLLMAAPISRRAVVASKLLDGMAFYYALLAALAGPALVAYGIGLAYGPAYYALAFLCLLAVPLLPAGLAALLVIAVARIAPATRVREALALLGAVFGASFSIAGQTARLWTGQVFGGAADPGAIVADLRTVASLPLPTFVAGRGLAAAGAGDLPAALAGVAGFLIIAFGTFGLCVLAADTLYATGWARMQSSGRARRGRVGARGGWLTRAPAALAIALKDWRLLPRDLRNFAQFIMPLLILPAVYVNLLARNSGRRSADPFQALNRWAGQADAPARAGGAHPLDLQGVAIAAGVLLLTVLVFGRVARTSVSREGQAWWVLKAAPITGIELLGGKLLTAAVPYAAISTLLFFGAAAWNRFSLAGTLYGWYGVELLGVAMLALNVAAGVFWVDLDWDDPRRMTSGWATAAALGSSALLGLIAGLALLLPLLAQTFAPALAAPAWVFGAGAALAVTTGVTALALHVGAGRLPQVGETA